MTQSLERWHQPVLVHEVLEGLNVQCGGLYVDGTVGGGGHAREILEHSGPQGRLLGIDWDPEAILRARARLAPYGERVLLHEGNLAEVEQILAQRGIREIHGMLLDLGASYEQLTSGTRGFSVRVSGPLDMRFSPRIPVTAQEILNHRSERELKGLFRTYGEERWAGRIARAIVRARPLKSTGELAELVSRAVPRGKRRLHPATRVFQALRIEVNQELINVEQGLRGAAKYLAEGGRLCIISYHSLEDRVVKHLFRGLASQGVGNRFRILTPKPVIPSSDEVGRNPSARSAKLRVLQRFEGEGSSWGPSPLA